MTKRRGHLEDRIRHFSGWYDSHILVWGGNDTLLGAWRSVDGRELCIYSPWTRELQIKTCEGPSPDPDHDFVAQIIGDSLFVISCDDGQTTVVRALDLKSLAWEKLETRGPPPLTTWCAASWKWKEFIYIFGGYGFLKELPEDSQVSLVISAKKPATEEAFNNQCVAFNTATSSWQWPRLSGANPPSPRQWHRCTVSGDYMLLFGGECNEASYKDLHALHLPSHTWSRLQGDGRGGPSRRFSHSFTAVGGNRAVVYGGFDGDPLDDCWLLGWSTGEDGIKDPKWKKWRKVRGPPRFIHSAEYDPLTRELIVIGGFRIASEARATLSISVGPERLLLRAASLIRTAKQGRVLAESLPIPVSLKQSLRKRMLGWA